MSNIPSFWDDESLTDNLNDLQAVKVLNWLERIYYHSPQHYSYALSAIKSLNQFAHVQNKTRRLALFNAIQDVLGISLLIDDPNSDTAVDQIIIQIKEQYEKL